MSRTLDRIALDVAVIRARQQAIFDLLCEVPNSITHLALLRVVERTSVRTVSPVMLI